MDVVIGAVGLGMTVCGIVFGLNYRDDSKVSDLRFNVVFFTLTVVGIALLLIT